MDNRQSAACVCIILTSE